ncbi:MAG: hypothetical protein ACI35W_02095 [Anaeroplasmataceae bacterium]
MNNGHKEYVNDEDLLIISEEEYEINKSKLEEAIGFASLDNHAEISSFAAELFEKMIREEITPSEVEEKLLSHYKCEE